jgi:hypothetical protein
MNQTPVDRRIEDIWWATHDQDVLDKYMGEYVVIYDRQVVAHGSDLEQAFREASRTTRKAIWELACCAVMDPLQDIPH